VRTVIAVALPSTLAIAATLTEEGRPVWAALDVHSAS